MPKRKASEASSTPDAAGAAGKSPNPRKKSKNEALAAAKKWHDKQRKSAGAAGNTKEDEEVVDGVVMGVAVPSGSNSGAAQQMASPPGTNKSKKEALAAAKSWHDSRRKSGAATMKEKKGVADMNDATDDKVSASGVAAGNKLAYPRQNRDKIPSQPSLLGEAKSGKVNGGSGGNAFLKSLRTKPSSSDDDGEDKAVPSEPQTNGKSSKPPPPTNEGVPSSSHVDAVAHAEDVSPKTDGPKRKNHLVEFVLIFIFSAVGVLMGLNIQDQQSFYDNEREQHVIKVEKVKEEISKSREVESVLRLGIDVLEQSQVKNYPVQGPAAISTLYNIEIDENASIQSEEEKAEWREGIQLLEEGKQSAMDDLGAKLEDLGVENGKVSIKGIKL